MGALLIVLALRGCRGCKRYHILRRGRDPTKAVTKGGRAKLTVGAIFGVSLQIGKPLLQRVNHFDIAQLTASRVLRLSGRGALHAPRVKCCLVLHVIRISTLPNELLGLCAFNMASDLHLAVCIHSPVGVKLRTLR